MFHTSIYLSHLLFMFCDPQTSNNIIFCPFNTSVQTNPITCPVLGLSFMASIVWSLLCISKNQYIPSFYPPLFYASPSRPCDCYFEVRYLPNFYALYITHILWTRSRKFHLWRATVFLTIETNLCLCHKCDLPTTLSSTLSITTISCCSYPNILTHLRYMIPLVDNSP